MSKYLELFEFLAKIWIFRPKYRHFGFKNICDERFAQMFYFWTSIFSSEKKKLQI